MEDCRPWQTEAHLSIRVVCRLLLPPREPPTWGLRDSADEKADARRSSLLGLQALHVIDFHVLDKAVELILGVLVLVSLTSDSDTHSTRNVPDAHGPDLSVEERVHAHFLKAQTANALKTWDLFAAAATS